MEGYGNRGMVENRNLEALDKEWMRKVLSARLLDLQDEYERYTRGIVESLDFALSRLILTF